MAAGRIVLSTLMPARDRNDRLVAGAKMYVYTNNTTTPVTIYTTSALSTPLANPVVANSSGQFADTWIEAGTAASPSLYTISITGPNGESIANPSVFDDYSPSLDYASDVSSYWRALLLTASQSAFLTAFGQISSSALGFLSSATGAVLRTVYDRLNDVVSVKDFGATGDGTTNDTTALNLALASGKSLRFPPGQYMAALLTSSANYQTLYADGNVLISKNANGALLTHSGTRPTIRGIAFTGDTFTGDGVVLTGTAPALLNCASQNMAGRAVKATGDRFTLIGTHPRAVYNTTDATASGYDLEIGTSGTTTLYHQIVGLQTSVSSGGILFTDTGSHVISGGQFGKLTIASGTSPAGVNGGMTMGARILGNVSVGLSSALFSTCQFSAITFTAEAGTSGVSVDRSNVWAVGSSYVNNGNVGSNYVVRDGAQSGIISNKYGPDASLAIEGYDPTSGDIYNVNGYTRYKNGRGIILNDGNGNVTMTGGNLGILNNLGATQIATVGNIQMIVGGVEYFRVSSAGPVINETIPPASAAATGTAGTIAWDTGYIYVCTAANTWKRVAIATW